MHRWIFTLELACILGWEFCKSKSNMYVYMSPDIHVQWNWNITVGQWAVHVCFRVLYVIILWVRKQCDNMFYFVLFFILGASKEKMKGASLSGSPEIPMEFTPPSKKLKGIVLEYHLWAELHVWCTSCCSCRRTRIIYAQIRWIFTLELACILDGEFCKSKSNVYMYLTYVVELEYHIWSMSTFVSEYRIL